MSYTPKPMTLADPKRFKTIQDLTRLRPDCGASIDDIFVIETKCLLIVDLSNVGALLNPYNSPEASYVRSHGVIVESYTFPESIPVLWCDPFLLLPLSHHLKGNLKGYAEIVEVVGNISCPSGSFLLLPYRMDIPTPLIKVVDDTLASKTGVKIEL
ncbi:MAG: hypothetical protein JSW04_13565, partial [Desulfobacterales bacterium]